MLGWADPHGWPVVHRLFVSVRVPSGNLAAVSLALWWVVHLLIKGNDQLRELFLVLPAPVLAGKRHQLRVPALTFAECHGWPRGSNAPTGNRRHVGTLRPDSLLLIFRQQ